MIGIIVTEIITKILIIILLLLMPPGSFYGDSSSFTPLRGSFPTSSVKAAVLTQRSDALLLLATGQTDFLLLALAGGRPMVGLLLFIFNNK